MKRNVLALILLPLVGGLVGGNAWAQDPHAGHRGQGEPLPAADAGEPGEALPPDAHRHAPPSTDPHAGMDHGQGGHQRMDHSTHGAGEGQHDASGALPVTPVPALTDADRAAAFPSLQAHAMHGERIHSYWSLDRLEAWDADSDGTGVGWEALAWVGTDIDRVWLRSEGERIDRGTEAADVEVLYGRSVSRWWDVVGGVRHDFGEGPSQTFAAFGVQGLAPMKFEVSATGYLGSSGQSAAQLEAEYETLLTNRLVLQWLGEATLYGKDDARRGIGSGLSSLEAGARLRYEFDRRIAPYIGVSWERAYGQTADFKRAHGEAAEETRIVAGIRLWF